MLPTLWAKFATNLVVQCTKVHFDKIWTGKNLHHAFLTRYQRRCSTMAEITISIFWGEHIIIALIQQLIGMILCILNGRGYCVSLRKCCRSNNPVNISYFHLIRKKNLTLSKLFLDFIKGQLISKCPFDVPVSTKIPTKFFLGFLP